MLQNKPIRRVAVIGTGVNRGQLGLTLPSQRPRRGGNGCCARCGSRVETLCCGGWSALQRLGLASGASQSRLSFTAALTDAVKDADLVQEKRTEKIEFKKRFIVSWTKYCIQALSSPQFVGLDHERDPVGVRRCIPNAA